MAMKPFKQPLLKHKTQASQNAASEEPPLKKRRVSDNNHLRKEDLPYEAPPPPLFVKPVSTFRKPLLPVVNSAPAVEATKKSVANGVGGYYNVLWRKFTTKKHKTWDGDGVLAVSGGSATLFDIDGREMGKVGWTAPLLTGSSLSVGGKDVEVDSIISKEDYLAGRPFLGQMKQPAPQPVRNPTLKARKAAEDAEKEEEKAFLANPASQKKPPASTFKTPLLSKAVVPKTNISKPQPRHDPKAPGALVMKRLSSAPKGKQIVDVVVDPIISKYLRDHQREGVKFLYECVMGMRHSGEGAILADEMGLGKTLQTIALIWTLLKQNPIYEDSPVVKKALIVCPVGLINNWRAEFRKWLGNERIGVFCVTNDDRIRLTDFTKGKAYNIMIIGYEKLRLVQDQLKQGAGIDIIIADEAHRMKTKTNKAAQAIKSLDTERRILLSGTPLQNNMSEFYQAIDFVSPGSLGKYGTFKSQFENPIVKMQQKEATAQDTEKGEARQKELNKIVGQFVLRRTADVLAKYLPPKAEYVLFCKPTSAQASVYKCVLENPIFGAVLKNSEASLQLINILKKVCNSPSLLLSKNDKELETSNPTISNLLSGIPSNLLNSAATSGKLQVLDKLLYQIRTTTKEKVVLVSNYTSTLDVLERLLNSLSYTWMRLDGSIAASKRQDLVNKFNRTDAATSFAFLLSAKAGGVGLNLIGASRLILFDIDWNPSTDLQAMARIHRDGQKLPCRIYRLLTQGALDEKIYQRQLTKMGLADSIVDKKASASSFTTEELRDLFRLDETGRCKTHDLLNCSCEGKGNVEALKPVLESEETLREDDVDTDEELPDLSVLMKAPQVNMEAQEQRIKNGGRTDKAKSKMLALMRYLHIDVAELDDDTEELVDDKVLLDVLKMDGNRVNFLFSKSSS